MFQAFASGLRPRLPICEPDHRDVPAPCRPQARHEGHPKASNPAGLAL